MVARKSHPKSRNGCPQCKKRRIKCDEIRPACGPCQKHEIECDFGTAQSPLNGHSSNPPLLSSPTSSSSPTKRRRRSEPETPQTPQTPSSVSSRLPDSSSLSQSLGQLPIEELELFHHFTTETCYTLSDRPESHQIWRVTVPQIAFQHDFLMRGMLAIAALHLAKSRPTMHEHYSRLAVCNQDAALSSFRPIMQGMDSTNCDASFAMSSLIVIYGFESPKLSNSLGLFKYNGEHSDDWLPLIRGVNSILQSLWSSVKIGRLRGLLHDKKADSASTQHLPTVLHDQLTELERLIESMEVSESDKLASQQALSQLRYSFVRLSNKTSNECEVSLSFLWPVMIPQEFILILNQRQPEALIILAYYCIILHHLDGYWWMRGWSSHIMSNIRHELGEKWQDWLNWPSSIVQIKDKVLTRGPSARAESDADQISQEMAF